MLKTALILGASIAIAGTSSPESAKFSGGSIMLFSGGAPALRILSDARGRQCVFESPRAPGTARSKPVFAAY